jgi:Putative Actinobacterial Holin-X, holin superfamily III
MQISSFTRTSLFGLFGELKHETKSLIKEEVQLAKTEISEKISRMGKNSVSLAIGGFVAYAGLIVFLAGLGLLLAYAFERLGLERPLATFIGLGIMGLVAGGIGFAFIAEAIKSFSHESVAPEKTLETLKDLKQEIKHTAREPEPQPTKAATEPKRSSDEIQASVVATEQMMGETVEEIGRRLTPHYASQQFKRKFQEHPYRWNLIAMGTGLVSALWVKHKINHNHARA